MLIRKQGDWLAADVGEELVMMSVEKGNYLGLSEVGRRIWELIDTPRTLDEICAELVAEFDVTPETCRSEVEAFLQELAAHDAVTFDPPPAA